jgi:hypothetical protein
MRQMNGGSVKLYCAIVVRIGLTHQRRPGSWLFNFPRGADAYQVVITRESG